MAQGGQQVCTKELRDIVQLTGYELQNIVVPNRLNIVQKIRNRITPLPYPVRWPNNLCQRIVEKIKENEADTVFFNLIDFLPLAAELRRVFGAQIKMVMLSHGLASADVLHINRISKLYPGIIYKCPLYNLNNILKKEAQYLPCFDLVVSISEFEAQLCIWLGAKVSCWIPRSITPKPIAWQPVNGLVGYIGTLDHPPSMEGMIKVLDELAIHKNRSLRVRIISRSSWHGNLLSRKYSFVEYLGSKESEVEPEVGTWCAFLNPIFCFARGCSTKLAVGLEWGIPCLTTPSGVRGYDLPKGAVVIASSPYAFAEETIKYSLAANAKHARSALLTALAKMPTQDDISKRLSTFLN